MEKILWFWALLYAVSFCFFAFFLSQWINFEKNIPREKMIKKTMLPAITLLISLTSLMMFISKLK
jgi:type VI protein secretion system component VasK